MTNAEIKAVAWDMVQERLNKLATMPDPTGPQLAAEWEQTCIEIRVLKSFLARITRDETLGRIHSEIRTGG